MLFRYIENGFSVIPETEFEQDYLRSIFLLKKNRRVVVKSGLEISDVVAVNVTATPLSTHEDGKGGKASRCGD